MDALPEPASGVVSVMLRLDRLLSEAANAPETVVAQNAEFRRSHRRLQFGGGINVELLCDTSAVHEITIAHLRFSVPRPGHLRLTVEAAKEAGHGRGFLGLHPTGGSVWLPAGLVARRHDQHARIESEEIGALEFCPTSGALDMHVANKANKEGWVIDLPLVHSHRDGDDFAREVCVVQPIEEIRLHQDDWYDVRSVAQLWQYFIHGRVLDPRWKATGKRVECQQCAHTWYAHLTYLHRQTGKRLYRALRDVIAHAVLLSLPSDHRWRHGSWTDGMETHTRFQTDGIHLLAQHYMVCGNGEFLDAACGAADYLITIADVLDDGSIWYLHDTLELGDHQAQEVYPMHRRSRAFGKQPENTLCLNTHVWTLTALWRLTTLCRDERRQRYERAFKCGMQSLNRVLSAKPGEAVYGKMYAVRDTCLGRQKGSNATRALRLCDAVFHRALRRFKPRMPRLAMPNGYIERDLERTTLSDRYVPVNLKDLALLAHLTGCEWLRPFVIRGLDHWIGSGLCQKELPRSATAQQALDAALLLAAEDADCRDVARVIFGEMRIAGRAVTVDALAGTVGADDWTLPRILPDAMHEVISG